MKRFLSMILVLMVTLMCMSGALAEERTTVTLAVWGSGAMANYEAGAAEFNSRQSAIDMQVEMSNDWSTFIGAKIASNDLPDLYYLNLYADVVAYAANGRLLDLSGEAFVGKLFDTITDSCMYEGATYAYPLCMEFLGIFYNPALFEQAGIETIPTTIDELRAACEKLTEAGITPFAATYLSDWTLNHAFSTLLGAVEPDWDGLVENLNNGGSFGDVARIQEVFDFFDLMKEYSGANFMDADSTAGFNAFGMGEAAMLFSGEFSLLNLDSINPDLKVGLMGVPVSNDPSETKIAVDTGICVGINPNGEHVEEALEVLRYMSDNEDTHGWFYNAANSLGAAPAAMEYAAEEQGKYQCYQDMNRLIADGYSQNWLFLRWASGFASGPACQSYFSGAADVAGTIALLDSDYQDNLE